MAFDLETITGLGIPQDKAEQLIARHDEVISELKAQAEALEKEAEELKPQAEEARRLEAELNELKEANGGKDYKAMYEAEKAAFSSLKAEHEAKEQENRKREAYGRLMRAQGIPEKIVSRVIRIIDPSSLRLDALGNLDNPEAVKLEIMREWGEFKPVKGRF